MEIIGVVLNCSDWFNEAARLMDQCFSAYTFVEMLKSGDQVGSITVKGGQKEEAPVLIAGTLAGPVLPEELPLMQIEYDAEITAPQPAGTKVGIATMRVDEMILCQMPLVLGEAVLEEPSPIAQFLMKWPLLAR